MSSLHQQQAQLSPAVRSQLESIFLRDPEADNVAICLSDSSVVEQETFNTVVKNHTVQVVACVSELAIREALYEKEQSSKDAKSGEVSKLVFLTKLDSSTLAQDILVHLWKRQPRHIDIWQTLVDRLRLRAIDPRLTRGKQRWFAQSLLEVWPKIEEQVNVGDVLDFDTAWLAMMRGWLGFEAGQLDLDTMLAWSLSSPAKQTIPQEMIGPLRGWFETRLSRISSAVSAVLLSDDGEVAAKNLLPLGLVCDLLYADHNDKQLLATRVRFEERQLGGEKIAPVILREFGQAAYRFSRRVVMQAGDSDATAELTRVYGQVERILQDLDCLEIAIHSDLLTTGYNLRLDAVGLALQKHIKAPGKKSDATLTSSLALLDDHLHRSNNEQKHTVKAAVALTRWLALDKGTVRDGTNAVSTMRDYRESGGFVDYARSRLWNGDSCASLAIAYEQLFERSAKKLEKANKVFASDIDFIARGDKLPPDLVYIEDTIEELLCPLVKQQGPVLLLIMDGMSQAVWREISNSVILNQWVEFQRSGADGPASCSLVAALPSITRICRHSLLTGNLVSGTLHDEQKGFSTHSELNRYTKRNAPPVVFHQGDLRDGGKPGLSSAVREKVADDNNLLVSVVVNVIDDQLASNDQLTDVWSEKTLPLVSQLLDAAREGNRTLVLTSDHGHVRAFDSARGDTGEDTQDGRFKTGDSSVEEGEVKVSGKRVVTENNTAVVPWSEKIRYANPKKGYHGGASLQEMVVPFAVYVNSAHDLAIEGWQEVVQSVPDWWRANDKIELVAEVIHNYEAPVEINTTGDLFAASEPEKSSSPAQPEWINKLLSSDVLAVQRKRAARSPVEDETLVALLNCLERRGNQASLNEIAEATGKSARRIGGLVATIRKLLNVDGFDILSEDRPSKTLRLNKSQLLKQFLIDE